MTSYFYKHAETGIVAEMDEGFAKVFGDRLIRVDSAEADDSVDTPTKPPRSSKSASAPETSDAVRETESPKEES